MSTDSPRGRRTVLAATSVGFAVVQLDVSVVNVAIAPIGHQLGGSVSSLQWVVNAYTVAFAALILTAGSLSDRLGARRVLTGAFILFAIGSAACGLAPTIGVLVAARTLQGVGAAALVPASLSMLSHTFPEQGERAKAIGIWALGASAALSAGPLVGGLLIGTLGWRAIFFINLPLTLFGIIAIRAHGTETRRSATERVDAGGQITAAMALALTVGGIILGGEIGFGQPIVITVLVLAALAAVGFVVREHRTDHPMLPPALFRSRAFTSSILIGLVINIAFYGLIFVLSLYFQRTLGYTPLLTGLAFLPMTASIMLTNVTAARLARRFGAPFVIGAAGALMTSGALGLLTTASATAYPAVIVQLFILGAGLGAIVPLLTATVLSSVGVAESGIASGSLNAARQTGSAIGVALFGTLLSTLGGVVDGLHAGLYIAAVIGIVTIGLAALVREESAG